MRNNMLARSLVVVFLFIAIGVYGQNKHKEKGIWVGYIMDLGQVAKGHLPKVYSIQLILTKKKNQQLEGVISKYWEKNYHTISGITGYFDPQTKSYNLIEKDLIQFPFAINSPSCRILTTLDQVDIDGKTLLQGRYYGIKNGNSTNEVCPVGLVHLEKPNNDSSYDNLISYLNRYTTVSPEQDEEEQAEHLAFSFPEVTISTIPFYTLQNTLKYDIYKLAKFQKTGETQNIQWNKKSLKMIIQAVQDMSDTVNVMLDDVIMASKHRLSSRSPIDIRMEFKATRALHKVSIIPFSVVEKDTHLKVLLFSGDGALQNSYTIKYKSNQNVEFDISVNIPPKEDL